MTIIEKKYKYRIYDILISLSHSEYIDTKRKLRNKLGVTHKRLDMMLYIPFADSTMDIKGQQLRVFSEELNVRLEELYTEPPQLLKITGGRKKQERAAAQ
jgi:hypothetical protein